jgi:hypothetical protein
MVIPLPRDKRGIKWGIVKVRVSRLAIPLVPAAFQNGIQAQAVSGIVKGVILGSTGESFRAPPAS